VLKGIHACANKGALKLSFGVVGNKNIKKLFSKLDKKFGGKSSGGNRNGAGNKAPSVRQQALDVKKNLNNNKNTVKVNTPNKRIQYDLDGAPHKGVETPHIQNYNKNIDPKTNKVYFNKDRKTAIPMNKNDVRVIKKILEKRKK
ncbi:MAG: hypothetical protein GY830_09840, partial [Bacteroidetes bacterium]|nr:hypothetical protein [Bacteroidota bacterium]